MPRYIDADEAKSDIKANDWSNPCIPTVVGIILDKIPTADVVEVKNLSPCDVCMHNPLSSGDGKPCCMCPAERERKDKECQK